MIRSSKDTVLKKIREALSQPTPIPFPKSEGQSLVFQPLHQELEIEFAERFTALQGQFAFCLSRKELISQFHALLSKTGWQKLYCQEPELAVLIGQQLEISSNPADLEGCDVAITSCEYLVARTGSIVMSSAQLSGRRTSVYAPVHICIAYTSQLVFDVKDALEGLKERYDNALPSLMTFATGPSRTADIEKTLVVGVHGPKEVFVFLIDDISE